MSRFRLPEWTTVLVAACAVLPRLGVVLHERGAILTAYTEKSDDFARVFISSGTYGLIPGQPSASTQPLYGWFLIPVYWIAGRHWWSSRRFSTSSVTPTRRAESWRSQSSPVRAARARFSRARASCYSSTQSRSRGISAR